MEKSKFDVGKLASSLAVMYDQVKYSPNPLVVFSLSYDGETALLSGVMGKYSDFLEESINRSREKEGWRETVRSMPSSILPALRKASLSILASDNWPLVRQEMLNILNENSREKNNNLEDILFDRTLAAEAATEYVDFSGVPLKAFLQRFKDKELLHPKSTEGIYHNLFRRLYLEHGENWKTAFYSLLPDNLKGRVELIASSSKERGVTDVDIVDLVEKLSDLGAVGLLESMGPDAYDLLVAMYGKHKFPGADRDIISQIIGKQKSLGEYLGYCLRPRKDSDTMFDWANGLLQKLSESLPVEEYQNNDVVQSILKTHVVAKYSRLEDVNKAIGQIEADLGACESGVEKALLSYALSHFNLMLRCAELKGVKKTLRTAVRKA